MNIYRFDLYITNKDIFNKLEPIQKEQLDNIIITNVQLFDNDCIHIECAALEKGIKITQKNPAYRQSLIDDGSYISAIEDERYI